MKYNKINSILSICMTHSGEEWSRTKAFQLLIHTSYQRGLYLKQLADPATPLKKGLLKKLQSRLARVRSLLLPVNESERDSLKLHSQQNPCESL